MAGLVEAGLLRRESCPVHVAARCPHRDAEIAVTEAVTRSRPSMDLA